MSGPKVVRVITREERIKRSQGLLAQLDKAIAEWIRRGEQQSVIDDTDRHAVEQQRKAIRALFDKEQFEAVQTQAMAEITHLQNDMHQRLEKKAKIAAQKRSSRRKTADAARAFIQ